MRDEPARIRNRSLIAQGREIEPIPAETDRVAKAVVDAAFRVHSTLGPGLLESVYEICLFHECLKRGLRRSGK